MPPLSFGQFPRSRLSCCENPWFSVVFEVWTKVDRLPVDDVHQSLRTLPHGAATVV
jgi:hypothetical protein